MKLDMYLFTVSANHEQYEFISIGPKGNIKKIVRFDKFLLSPELEIVNLAFGDLNEDTRDIDDENVSNNADTEKVLATVARIAVDFTDSFPWSIIYAAGATPDRTRKYQMALNRQYGDVVELFHVFGMTKEGKIVPFEKNVNYVGFLVRRKPKKHP
jgi:hypothetical protein